MSNEAFTAWVYEQSDREMARLGARTPLEALTLLRQGHGKLMVMKVAT